LRKASFLGFNCTDDDTMSDFQDLLEAQIPRLRRHARALTRDAHRADYLVLDTLLRALMKQDRWEPGTNDRGYSICQRIGRHAV